ncbi:pyruvate kinase [Actinomycetospora callitridis]|uniref:pyruvate kinase n=1 Tax=Actinomycetospora callitridis TaxID=913944 RepID=UPI002366510A|nr:pyruvate kinase [Actinomycetospora callitridis]MDD7920764.1 pyruvate kinase [Actinomycetospora callitridis]
MSRRAKIVCTLGPSTSTPEAIRDLVRAGMDVARLNFSHGEHAEHERIYRLVREAADTEGRAVGILADLQGPKIRLGRFADGPQMWATGETVTITTEDVAGTHDRVGTTYKGLADDARPGESLLIDDGNVALEVSAVEGRDVVCRVIEGGRVSDNKGISLPHTAVSVPAMSDKDEADLRFALGLRVDMIALSFVRSPADAELVHKIMDEYGSRLPVIAKIEKPEAVDALEAIVLAFDSIMVARGDLGVELALEDVPLVQKRAVQIARENAKPVIVATQMLESMIHNFRPTRAEASDVANAVLDGADAVMLSGETSVGDYPIETVQTMSRIVAAVEVGPASVPPIQHVPRTQRGVVTTAARDIGERLNARALVAFTRTGDTVRRLARLHTRLPVLAFSPIPEVRSQLALSWGVETFLVPWADTTDAMIRQVDASLLEIGRFAAGELVVIVSGSPPGTVGKTNLLRVHKIGEDAR